MAGGVLSAKKLTTADRRQLAIELRKSGMSFREIADAVRNELIMRSAPELVERLEKEGKPFSDIMIAVEEYLRFRKRPVPQYSHMTARRDVQAVLDEANEKTAETAVQMRSLMDMQLDELLKTHWTGATTGDIEKGRFILQVIATRMKLYSLDRINEGDANLLQQNFFVNPIEGLPPRALQHLIENLAVQMQEMIGLKDDDFWNFIEQLSASGLGLPSGEGG